MKVEIDQSGKIEDTNKDTILAFSNGKKYSIKIPAKVKRSCLLQLRSQGREGKTIYILLFSIVLFLLLQDFLSKIDSIVIDQEYPGHENDIKSLLKTFFKKIGKRKTPDISFWEIGKESPAHVLAYKTYRKLLLPDKKITLEDILGLIGEK